MANTEIREDNNIIEVENQDVLPIEAEEAEDAGLSTAAAMLIGGAITAGVIWAVGKVKKFIAARKAEQAASEEPEEEDFEDELKIVEPIETEEA